MSRAVGMVFFFVVFFSIYLIILISIYVKVDYAYKWRWLGRKRGRWIEVSRWYVYVFIINNYFFTKLIYN